MTQERSLALGEGEHALMPRNASPLEAMHPDGLVAKISGEDAPQYHVATQEGNLRASRMVVGRFGLVGYIEFNPYGDSEGRIHLDAYLLVPDTLWAALGSVTGFQELFKARHLNPIEGGGPYPLELGNQGGSYQSWYFCDIALPGSIPEDVEDSLQHLIKKMITFERELDVMGARPPNKTALPRLSNSAPNSPL
ncbi:hypothetical protein J4419_01050 [Candidatus Woesearchaeota archaeon]|nr:hypothetical protein [Candidatus Woesearchaeota archaeon]